MVDLLKGDYKSAANNPLEPGAGPRDWDLNGVRLGLIYLAALRAKDALVAEEQWKKLAESLGHGDRSARRLSAMMTGKQPFDENWILEATLLPKFKRVLLVALARKFPAHAAKFTALAKKLDFDRDETSLCLRYLSE